MTSNKPHLNPVEQQALSEFTDSLGHQFGNLLKLVVLFGSKARGDSTSDSDIDVLIVVDSEDWQLRKQINYLAVDICLKYDYQFEISPRVWSTSHFKKMKTMQTQFYQNIQRDGINLWQPALVV